MKKTILHPILIKSIYLLALVLSPFLNSSSWADTSKQSEKFSYTPYLSLRMQAESVHPDNQSSMNDYRGLRDAFSRVGVNAAYRFSEDYRIFGQLEVPFDTANFRFGDPYDQGGAGRDDREDLRVARLGLETPIGTWVAGQQWMPYYNTITYPVDQFSTFYSGFATYTTFRVKETLSYVSPTMKGFSFGGSYSSAAGNVRSPSRIDDRRIQTFALYSYLDTVLGIGMDDRGNADGYTDRLYGLSVAKEFDNWSLVFKYETTYTDNPNSFYGDGADGYNIYTEYRHGKLTYKAMLADVESYGETVLHIGIDHQIKKDLILFAEYYQEQETAALTGKQDGLAGFNSSISGGKMFAAGFRYFYSF